MCAGIEHQRSGRRQFSLRLRQQLERLGVLHRLGVPEPVSEAGRMGQQVAQRDRPLCRPQLRQSFAVEAIEHLRRADRGFDIGHRRVQRQLVLLDELQRGHRRNQLHHRGDAKHRVARHGGAVAEPALAENPLIEDAMVGRRQGHYSRHFSRARRGAEHRIDLGNRFRLGLGRRLRAGGCRVAQAQRAGRRQPCRRPHDIAATGAMDHGRFAPNKRVLRGDKLSAKPLAQLEAKSEKAGMVVPMPRPTML